MIATSLIIVFTSNNFYIVQNFKTIAFQVFESFNNDQRLGETLTRLKSSNGVTRFHG